tara:strand:+ start:1910 stop:2437 length:528 start_codon:yes stop_codon:yes gene_type:complete
MAISVTKPTVGGSEDTWGATVNTGLDTIVNALNGTSGTVAPNLSTLTVGGVNVTATAAEVNTLAGVTATAAELNSLSGSLATTAELNVLAGVTATTAQVNYVNGVTSGIQAQLNAITANPTFTGTVNVTTVDFGDWTITESGGVLRFATGGANKMKLDASGNLTVVGDVTAYGTI